MLPLLLLLPVAALITAMAEAGPDIADTPPPAAKPPAPTAETSAYFYEQALHEAQRPAEPPPPLPAARPEPPPRRPAGLARSTPHEQTLTLPPPARQTASAGCHVLVTAPEGAEQPALRAAARLRARGVDVDCFASDPDPAAETTLIRYRRGHAEMAERIALLLGGRAERRGGDSTGDDVEVRVGRGRHHGPALAARDVR